MQQILLERIDVGARDALVRAVRVDQVDRAPVRDRGHDGAGHLLQRAGLVGKLGQALGNLGEEMFAILAALALGDVDHDRNRVLRDAVLVAHYRQRVAGPDYRAVLAHVTLVGVEWGAIRDQPLELHPGVLDVFRVRHVEEAQALQLFDGAPHEIAEALVGVQDDAGQVRLHDAGGRLVHDRAEPLLAREQPRFALAQPQQRAYHGDQHYGFGRLGQIDVRAVLDARRLVIVGHVGRGDLHHRNFARRRIGLDAAAHFEAAHVGELHVEQRDVRTLLAHDAQGFGAGARLDHLEALLDQRARAQVARRHVVVEIQYARGFFMAIARHGGRRDRAGNRREQLFVEVGLGHDGFDGNPQCLRVQRWSKCAKSRSARAAAAVRRIGAQLREHLFTADIGQPQIEHDERRRERCRRLRAPVVR